MVDTRSKHFIRDNLFIFIDILTVNDSVIVAVYVVLTVVSILGVSFASNARHSIKRIVLN